MIINVSPGIVYIDGVQYHQVDKDTIELSSLLDRITTLRVSIDDMLQHGQALYDDYKLEKLSIGMIEAEGYLRATKQIHNIFDAIITDSVD